MTPTHAGNIFGTGASSSLPSSTGPSRASRSTSRTTSATLSFFDLARHRLVGQGCSIRAGSRRTRSASGEYSSVKCVAARESAPPRRRLSHAPRPARRGRLARTRLADRGVVDEVAPCAVLLHQHLGRAHLGGEAPAARTRQRTLPVGD